MSDVVSEATEVLVPLLSMGAGAAARELAERGGDQVAAVVTGILAKLRLQFKGQAPARTDIEAALRSEMADGQLSDEHLKIVLSLSSSTGSTHIDVRGNAIIDSTMTIQGNLNLGDSNS
jgi:hypothetical protein